MERCLSRTIKVGSTGLRLYPSPASTAVAELLRKLRINPLGLSRDRDFRISLAGVQSKTALLKDRGRWFLPEGATLTTHILKPAIGKVLEGPDFSHSVENEWLCLRILGKFGLKVAQAEIEEYDSIKFLSVERFDRSWSGKRLYRLPQEDLCQAMGLGPSRKYESEGGPGIGEILKLLNESNERDLDRRNFMKAQVLFWLLAATDGHAKNFSVAIGPEGFSLTPFYDVISVDPVINPKTLPYQKIALAMSVGRKHYRVREILPRNWRQTATEHSFDGIDEIMSEVILKTPRVIDQINRGLPSGFPNDVSDKILAGMTRRAKILAMDF